MFGKIHFRERQKEAPMLFVDIEKIRPNPYQPRKRNSRVSMDELCNSIKEHGIIQPVTVRKVSGDVYELISGERRLNAAKVLKMKKIPAILMDVTDEDSAVIALVENLQREDLDFLEEAEGYRNLMEIHGMTQEEIAEKVGKSQSTIANKLRLLKLPEEIKKIIKENGLTERHARAILKLPDEQMQARLINRICKKGLNVIRTEEIVNKYIEMNTREREDGCPGKEKKMQAILDVRVLTNTIKQTIEQIRKSGVNVKMITTNRQDYVEYLIKIPK